jgi:2-aminoethylphosphonate-pyruvate transaminase
MSSSTQDPWLLTPGPLTTSMQTKKAMLHDWGSRDENFIATNQRVLSELLNIANGKGTHTCVPLQGSGTFIVEAVLSTMIPKSGKALVLINGAYGKRMVKILQYANKEYSTLETPEDIPPNLINLDKALKSDQNITHVLVIYCETTSGILNPIEDIAKITEENGRKLIIDAMSAFGAVELDARKVTFDAMMASSNKCLEGVPGFGFGIIRQSALEICKDNAHTLSLDLFDQWKTMLNYNQWRFTPPTHVIYALDSALKQFKNEGGLKSRHLRYSNNCRILIDGMRALGFETLLPDELQAPIIVTFKMPSDKNFNFKDFYEFLSKRGYLIYPGKLTVIPSFRIGCIGHIGEKEMHGAIKAIGDTLNEMNVTNTAST